MRSISCTRTFASIWILLFTIQALVQGHMVDVHAGKKECFFEDLHKHDKVRLSPTLSRTFPQLRPRWQLHTKSVEAGTSTSTSGSVILLAVRQPLLMSPPDVGSRQSFTRETSKGDNRNTLNHSGEGRATRILLLEPNECYCRQSREVRVFSQQDMCAIIMFLVALMFMA